MRRLALPVFAFLGLLWAGEAQAVCKLPYVLNNGTVTDAVKVMADLNALANCSGGSSIGNCSPTVPGSVPATGGGTINFLRADCTFAEPPGQPVTLIDCSGDNHALQSTTTDFICVTDVAQFDKNQTWTANQAMPPTILTAGATIAWDGLSRNYFEVTLDGNNETLAAGTNVRAGNYTWFIKTGAGFTGFSTDASFNFFGGTPTWSTGAGKEDLISCLVDTALRLNCFAGLDSGAAGGGVALTNAQIFVGNASNIATGVPVSGVLTLANTGAFSFASSTGSGAVVLASGPSIATPTVTGSFTATGLVTLADIATETANTVVANVTSGTASPTAASLPSCTDAGGNHLNYTNGTGFSCGTSGSGASLSANNTWTKAQAVTPVALTPGAGTIAVDGSLSNGFTLTIGNDNNTLGNPTNLIAGQNLNFQLTVGAGGHTGFATGTNYKYATATAPTWSTAAAKIDVLTCWAVTTSVLECSAVIDVR